MTERRLRINLEGLWNNPNELFTVRYKDINQKLQKILAKRIKANAPQHSLKKPTGPSPEVIEEALHEINPIIFSEYLGNGGWYRNHQVFGISPAIYVAGYRFRALCQGIYLMTCRRKALTTAQITNIARLTYSDWEVVEQYVNQRLGIMTEEDEVVTPIENLGIEDIHRAGESVDRNNPINRIMEGMEITPDENYDNPEREEERIARNMLMDIEAIPHPERIWQAEYRPEIIRIQAIPDADRIRRLNEINDARRAAGQSPMPPRGLRPDMFISDEIDNDNEEDEDEDIFEEAEPIRQIRTYLERPEDPHVEEDPFALHQTPTTRNPNPLIQELRRTFGLDQGV